MELFVILLILACVHPLIALKVLLVIVMVTTIFSHPIVIFFIVVFAIGYSVYEKNKE